MQFIVTIGTENTESMKPMKILIIEDDTVIANALKNELEKSEYEVTLIQDFSNIMDKFHEVQPHLVLIDINLPYHNGYYWCSQIRVESNVPIIFISSLSDKMDQMMAIQMGGDDYIPKPIDLQLTAAKIQALLRRTYDFATPQSNELIFHGVRLDPQKSEMSFKNQNISLTFTELQIMTCLFEHGEKFATREEILDFCWQNDQFIDDNTLAVNISRLRKKMKEIQLTDFIETKKKVGYRLASEAVLDD
ncbi:MAG TPA: response regulator transcription factor [Atopostipes sp.]|nr:response regulator transcription factor [Atopostipes sp.]